jgi:hypothetical protein
MKYVWRNMIVVHNHIFGAVCMYTHMAYRQHQLQHIKWF